VTPYRSLLTRRLARNPARLLDVRSTLKHFALINYALPKERLEKYIPLDHFDIPEFQIRGRRLAMMSAVPFLDVDFHFINFPLIKFRFGQTNYRVYVIDKRTGEPCVWFFGTTLGSVVVYAARLAWQIPWHYARFKIECENGKWHYATESKWGEAEIEIEDSGEVVSVTEGFESYDQMKLILTQPIDGFFYRLDDALGSYSVWHDEMNIRQGRAKNLYFGLYERLGLLSRDEMQKPHSIFLCDAILFDVYLPPRKIT
jgi:hypothetical protein